MGSSHRTANHTDWLLTIYPGCQPAVDARPTYRVKRGRSARIRLQPMRRLLPDPQATTIEQQLDSYRPWKQPHPDRPFLAMNFVTTLDGRATIEGVSGPIGSDADTA